MIAPAQTFSWQVLESGRSRQQSKFEYRRHSPSYPFEEQLDIPALSVEFCDCQGFVSQKVGKEAVDLTGSEVFICDHSESLGIAPGWLDSCKFDDLIADYTGFGITSSGLNNFVQHVVLCPLCPCYEECSVLVDVVEESEEINITFVQKIDGSQLDTEIVQHTEDGLS